MTSLLLLMGGLYQKDNKPVGNAVQLAVVEVTGTLQLSSQNLDVIKLRRLCFLVRAIPLDCTLLSLIPRNGPGLRPNEILISFCFPIAGQPRPAVHCSAQDCASDKGLHDDN